MSTYVIFDVEIRDLVLYQQFMKGVKPEIEAAGGRYLARGGVLKVHEGDWRPRASSCSSFHRSQPGKPFYNGETYQGPKEIRDECSSSRLVSVEGSVTSLRIVLARLK
jgi:uncharacterized protein (DUF1330 family)